VQAVKWIISLGLALLSMGISAAQEVRVGAYHFPPYVVAPGPGESKGLLPSMLKHLNELQSDFRFVVVPTSSARRHRDFNQGRYDLIFFESPTWGWQESAFDKVDLQLQDAELFVARAEPGRGEDYFDSLSGKRLALIHGYHYAFAQFNTNPQFLVANYQAELGYSCDSNLLRVIHGRSDVALVTRSYLEDFLRRHPEHTDNLLISRRIDQLYRHKALLRPDAPISVGQLEPLLRSFRDSGRQQALFKPFGIHPPSPD
jgi:ABC-type amino acid transport substrate-binding protein